MERKITGIVLCITAVICIVIGITTLSSNQYKASVAGYNAAMIQYRDNKSSEQSSQLGLFKYGYNRLAEINSQRAEEYQKVINKYRTQAIVLFCIGAVSLIAGIVIPITGKKESTEEPPQS